MTPTEQKIWANVFVVALQERGNLMEARTSADVAIRELRAAAVRLANPPRAPGVE